METYSDFTGSPNEETRAAGLGTDSQTEECAIRWIGETTDDFCGICSVPQHDLAIGSTAENAIIALVPQVCNTATALPVIAVYSCHRDGPAFKISSPVLD